ncbi:MAG: di-heme oxidoredictase family protein, partial [Cystobacter sp.]
MKSAYPLLTVAWSLLTACGPSAPAPDDDAPPSSRAVVEEGEELPGGTATLRDSGSQAFSRPAPSLPAARLSAFGAGEALFEANWFASPSSLVDRDGLGPLFNSVSCEACHFQNGRGAPPVSAGQPTISLLLRLSVPGRNEHGGPLPEPTYGDQLQTLSVSGVPAEGRVTLTWEETTGTFADGEPWT